MNWTWTAAGVAVPLLVAALVLRNAPLGRQAVSWPARVAFALTVFGIGLCAGWITRPVPVDTVAPAGLDVAGMNRGMNDGPAETVKPLAVGAPFPTMRAEGWLNGPPPTPGSPACRLLVVDLWAPW